MIIPAAAEKFKIQECCGKLENLSIPGGEPEPVQIVSIPGGEPKPVPLSDFGNTTHKLNKLIAT